MATIKQSHLRVFATVAEMGSISVAAKKLHRSPSAVSMMVANLEHQLNQPLFEPDSKSKLTPFGRYVFDIAREQLKRFDQALSSIQAYANNNLGRLDIAVLPSFANTYLPGFLQDFIARYPQITLSIRDDSSAHIKQLLLQGDIDLGIASPSADVNAEATIVCQPLFSDPLGVVCGRSHPLASMRRRLLWQDLRAYHFIANGTCALIQDEEFQFILDSAVIEVQNTTSLLALVAAGVGISTLPRLAVSTHYKDVVFKATVYPALVRTIGIITVKNRTLSPAAAAFSDLMRADAPATFST